MNRTQRNLWIAVGTVAVLTLGLTAGAATVHTYLRETGMLRVSIDDRGADPVSFSFAMPSIVPETLVAVTPLVLPADAKAEVERELGRFGPGLDRLADQLADLPDATLVEVEDGTDHVTVSKRGGSLLVQVRSPEANVEVEVPLRLVRRTLASLT